MQKIVQYLLFRNRLKHLSYTSKENLGVAQLSKGFVTKYKKSS